MDKTTKQQVVTAAEYVRDKLGISESDLLRVGMVGGSGWGDFILTLGNLREIPFKEIPFADFGKDSGNEGHAGRLCFGALDGHGILAMRGRRHLYEGYTPQESVFLIRVMIEVGIGAIVLTNAAGGINPNYRPGDLVVVNGHINFTGTSPLVGPHDDSTGYKRFPDMSGAYDEALIQKALGCAEQTKINLRTGVLGFMLGPQYETPAEIRALRILGADLATMSVVPETIAAAEMGCPVLALSCVANPAAGLGGKLFHHDALGVVERAVKEAVPFLNVLFKDLHGSS